MLRFMLRTSIIGFILLPLFAQVLFIDKNHHFAEKTIISILDIISESQSEQLHASATTTKTTIAETTDLNLNTLSLPCSEEFECIVNFQINGKEILEESDLETIVYYQELFKKTIAKIPNNLWQSLNKITFSFDENITRGAASGSQIRLRIVNVTDEEFVAVSIHELGHLVDLGNVVGIETSGESSFPDGAVSTFNDDASVDFYTMNWQDPFTIKEGVIKNRHNFISGYSKTDCFEQFAETFLTYALHPELLKYRNADQYNYFKDEIFDGYEYDDLSLVSDYDDYFYDATVLPYDLAMMFEEN